MTAIPDGERDKDVGRTLVIGDIHGHYVKLMRALEYAGFDESGDRILGLGDYIDRGPDSARVLSYLAERKARYPGRDVYLREPRRGHHDAVRG